MHAPFSLPVVLTAPHACPYRTGFVSQEIVSLAMEIDSPAYQVLMEQGFRRSGAMFYRQACPACDACVPIRVPVDDFEPSRSQRRLRARNRDVEVSIGAPCADDERWALFLSYQAARHDEPMISDRDEFRAFFGASPIDTIEMTYRVEGRLIGVGVVDVCPDAMSSVYFYFDPGESKRGLGTFSGLCEIDACRRRGLRWWYVGLYIADCRKMSYKTRFRPHELRGPDGSWHAVTDAAGEHPSS